MRLIDADALYVDIAMIAKAKAKSDAQKALIGRVLFVVENYHTIDAEPVKHGHWITDGSKIYLRHKCSECGNAVILKYPYCENCGAKMDGGENE